MKRCGATEPFGTLTFDSFPEGTHDLDFNGTFFVNDAGVEITDFNLFSGSVMIPVSPIPEPSTVVAACFALLAAGFHAFTQWRKTRRS